MVMERSRRFGRYSLLLLCAAVVACGGDPASIDDPKSTVPTSVDMDQAWLSVTASIEFPGEPELDVGSSRRPSISSIVWTPDGYRAAGVVDSGVTIWSSDDGLDWVVVEPAVVWCCPTSPRGVVLSVWGEKLLAVLNGNTATTGESVSWLWSSPDGGTTWVQHDGLPWGVSGNRADQVVPGESVVLGAFTVDGPSGPTSSLWRSSDLDSWAMVDLAGQPATGWVTAVAGGNGSFLVAAHSVNLPLGPMPLEWGQVIYSADGQGEGFIRVHGDLGSAASPLGAVAGRFIAHVDPFGASFGTVAEGPVVAATMDGTTWEVAERNTGVWGDGWIRVGPLVTAPSGIGYLVVDQVVREDDRYCFDDVASCEEQQTVLLATADGLSYEVADVELIGRGEIVAGADGSLLFWHRPSHRFQLGSPDLLVQVWNGPDPPPTHEPAPLSPPGDDRPVLSDFSGVAPGDVFRARLPVGECSPDRLEIGGRWYVTANPVAEPIPADWPFKAEQVTNDGDGPTGYLFVEGRRPNPDTFTFQVTPTTTLEYRFDPEGAPEYQCG